MPVISLIVCREKSNTILFLKWSIFKVYKWICLKVATLTLRWVSGDETSWNWQIKNIKSKLKDFTFKPWSLSRDNLTKEMITKKW